MKIPTIKELLFSMPDRGTDTLADRLKTYEGLYFHATGKPGDGLSVRALRSFVSQIDGHSTHVFTQLEDLDNDRFGFTIDGEEHWIASPTLRKMPNPDGPKPQFYRDCIALADDPTAILALPYHAFSTLTETLGKVMGFL